MAKATEWEELSSEIVYHKYSQTIERRDFRLPDGKIADFYVRIEKRGVGILAITTDNKVITIPQFRPGPKKILRELPGGQVEEGMDFKSTAVKELLEETGYAGEMEDWMATWECDAYTQANRALVIIKNCKKVAEPELEEFEFGEVELIDMPELIALVRSGQLTDTAGAMLALDYLGYLK